MAWIGMIGGRSRVENPPKPPSPKIKRLKRKVNKGIVPPDPLIMLPTSKIELTISCKGLLSVYPCRSDPYCVVSIKRQSDNYSDYKEVARTEIIENTYNPKWMKKIIIDYYFEVVQSVCFTIRVKDGFLGRYDTTVSKLIANCGRQTIGKLDATVGEIIIVTEEVSSCKQAVEIQFKAENLPKPLWPRSNDTFLVISRSNEDASYSIVVSTERVRSKKNSIWEPIEIRTTTLCNGDFDKSLKLDCYNFKRDGKHKLIGSCYVTLHSMITMHENGETRDLVNEENQKTKREYVSSGILKVAKLKIIEEITFLDYIRNGTQMHFAVAIDFTASNGVHTDPKSLHYLNEDHMNGYEIALRGVGDIVEQYDSSHLFPAFGFGAKVPPSNTVSFQFPLNGNPSHPFCTSIEEIIKHYRNQLSIVELYGPTNFAPVVNDTISIAKEFQDGKHYFVLLIITDGVISDMILSKLAIIEASKLPISIIIVGVGDNEFEAMEALDSDNELLSVDDLVAERDIVQFVPLKKFLSQNRKYIKYQTDLAEEVLAEIPQQLTDYYLYSSEYKPEIPSNLPSNSSVIVPTAPTL